MAHVYVRAAGYSKRVVPARIPFEFVTVEQGALIATPAWRDAPPSRRVEPDAPVDPSGSPNRVADVIAGPSRREWWIETSVYSVPLPRDWTAIASGEVSPAFDLVRGDCVIFIQTARTRPGIDALATVGQREVVRGSDDTANWVELEYTHDGAVWVQRHSLLRQQSNAMITSQGPAEEFADARVVQQEICRRVEFS